VLATFLYEIKIHQETKTLKAKIYERKGILQRSICTGIKPALVSKL